METHPCFKAVLSLTETEADDSEERLKYVFSTKMAETFAYFTKTTIIMQ